MGTTNAQRRKMAKKQARSKRIARMRNIRMNEAEPKFRLDVLIDDSWRRGVKEFKSLVGVEKHKAETEERRRKGEFIAPGMVVSLTTGKVVAEIAGSKEKGMAPDAIADGPKAAPDVSAEK